MGHSDVKVITISDEVALDANGISEAAAVGNNAALTISSCTAVMMLVDDNQTMWDQTSIENYGLTFSGIEAFTS